MNVEQARFNMIEQQIRPWEVLDQGVLGLLATLRREDFVPPAHHALAFFDTEVPLADGQYMLAPKVEARLLQALALDGGESVLEVGAGSGFMAALLAGQADRVTSFEIRPALAEFARDNLLRAGISHARVIDGDGSVGLPSQAPFDAIVLSGSVAEVPQVLLQQLTIGGRLVGIVGQAPVMRAVLIERVGALQYKHSGLFDTVAPRLDAFAEPGHFAF